MLHNSKRWAFPCPADEVGSESLKPFEGPCRASAQQLCLGNLPEFTSAADKLMVTHGGIGPMTLIRG